MSLILNDTLHVPVNLPDDGPLDAHHDLANIDRYLAIIENNKKSCRFVPDDAMLALDMAGFVRGQLRGNRARQTVSIPRLALALVQPCVPAQ